MLSSKQIVRVLGRFAISLSLLSPLPVYADSLMITPHVCLDEATHLKPKFENLLDAASKRDFDAFKYVNGKRNFRTPKFASLDEGEVSAERAFGKWADIANPAPQLVRLMLWEPVLETQQSSQKAFRAYFVRIERSEWSVATSSSSRVSEDYLVYGYGCDLFSVQETKFPYLENNND